MSKKLRTKTLLPRFDSMFCVILGSQESGVPFQQFLFDPIGRESNDSTIQAFINFIYFRHDDVTVIFFITVARGPASAGKHLNLKKIF